MRVSVYTSFDVLPDGVRRSLSYPSQPNFQRSVDWFCLLFDTSLDGTVAPRIYVAFDAKAEPVGALFCGAVGRRLTSLTNFYSLEFGCSNPPLDEILRYVAAERPRWHAIHFDRLHEGSTETRCAIEALEQVRYAVQPHFQYENWFERPRHGETFQDYFARRPSQVRHTITRKRKKLEREARVEIRVLREESPDLDRVLGDWIRIYQSSWKRPEPFPKFIPGLVRACARLGILRLGVLYVDDVPAAGQLWITEAERTIIYKLAYDEGYRERGVGSILSHEMFRIAIDEDRVREIDYGVGSESYKKDWMSEVRRLVGLEAHSVRTLRGLAAVGVSGLARIARRTRG
jgi:GNAT acetyltransferase-like protein